MVTYYLQVPVLETRYNLSFHFFLFEPVFSSHFLRRHDNALYDVPIFVKFKKLYHIFAKHEDFYGMR